MGAKGHQLKRHIDETLRVGNVKEAVRLPPGEDLNEWLAVNTVQFFLAASTLYSMLEDFCDANVCPTMNAGPKFEYLWADGVKVKKPIKLPAPGYMEKLFEWIEEQVDDEGIFPTSPGGTFPQNFVDIVKNIFKRLFRVYGHIYHHHFKNVCSLQAEVSAPERGEKESMSRAVGRWGPHRVARPFHVQNPQHSELQAHLNSCFKHFMYFTFQFELVDQKELTPLHELIQELVRV